MMTYNLLAEYSAFVIILAVLFSFKRDYEPRNLRYKLLQSMYYSALISVFVTICSTQITTVHAGAFSYSFTYIMMMLYYLFLPTVSLTFILYSVALTKLKENEANYSKKLLPYCIPYIIYSSLVLTNIFTGLVFNINEQFFYVRGNLYQLPYIFIFLHGMMLLYITIKNVRTVYRETMQVLSFAFIFASLVIIIQFHVQDVLFTGISHTICVLIVHLYIQNVRKSADHLTSVLNRISLTHKIEDYIKKQTEFSLYIVSLRNFKSINEKYGLEVGDKVLQYVSKCLVSTFTMTRIFRYSGDEFAILTKSTSDEFFNTVKETISSLLSPFTIDDIDMMIDLVFVRVDYPKFAKNSKDLISAADYSIKNIKQSNNELNYIYDTSIMEMINNQYAMTRLVKDAIENDMFIVHYQPIYFSALGSFTQAEALVRIKGKDNNIIYPDKFISLSEKSGLITAITYKVLEIVCRDLRYLIDNNLMNNNFESVSVNFPYFQFSSHNMVEHVMSILDKFSISPSMIKIEITERTLITEDKFTQKTMQDLKDKGFIFELDDFGTDYSNINVILNLPLDYIKIDRSLLISAMKSKENTVFFNHLVWGIKATNKQIIVEGVETELQRQLCQRSCCDFMQGYLFSKPVSLEDLIKFISK